MTEYNFEIGGGEYEEYDIPKWPDLLYFELDETDALYLNDHISQAMRKNHETGNDTIAIKYFGEMNAWRSTHIYYFLRYEFTRNDTTSWKEVTALTNQHPLDYLAESAELAKENGRPEEYRNIWWREVPRSVYERHKDNEHLNDNAMPPIDA